MAFRIVKNKYNQILDTRTTWMVLQHFGHSTSILPISDYSTLRWRHPVTDIAEQQENVLVDWTADLLPRTQTRAIACVAVLTQLDL